MHAMYLFRTFYLCQIFYPGELNLGRFMLPTYIKYTVRSMYTRTVTIEPRVFAVSSSPAVWNSLLVELRDPGLGLLGFRKKLETHLFIYLPLLTVLGCTRDLWPSGCSSVLK